MLPRNDLRLKLMVQREIYFKELAHVIVGTAFLRQASRLETQAGLSLFACFFFFFIFYFIFIFIILLYNIVLVLPYINI